MATRRRSPPPKRPRKTTRASGKAAKKPAPAKAKAKRTPAKTKSGGARGKSAGAKARKPTARRRLFWRVAKWSFIFALWLVVLGAGFIGYYAHNLPDTEHLTGPETPLAVTMLAADGSEIATVGEIWGELVPVREMAPVLPRAVLAIEDHHFHEHGGIDAFGMIRAAWHNAVEGRVVAGGSTISQQMAKLVFLTLERSVRRKIQEAMLAFWLEREFSKDEILTIYLNRAYFGAGAYGVDAAARRYFGRSARDVDAAQAALSETLAEVGRERRIGQGALVALDESGAVRAMVGGRDHAKSVFNRATQARRQPGSAFKTVVYLAGMEAGLRADDMIDVAPITIAGWSPRNYDGEYRGPVTVGQGFARSINTVAVRVGLKAGVSRM